MKWRQVNWGYLIWEAKRVKKNQQSLRHLSDTTQHPNTCIMGVPEGVGKGAERISEEIMTEKSLNRNDKKNIILKIQEAQQIQVQ